MYNTRSALHSESRMYIGRRKPRRRDSPWRVLVLVILHAIKERRAAVEAAASDESALAKPVGGKPADKKLDGRKPSE